jgi:PIN domain nuclease of toxin-antitoxin system
MAGRTPMNLLLDTAAFLWLCAGAKQLSGAAAEALAEPANTAALSAISAWEVALKANKGMLSLPTLVGLWFPAMVTHHRLTLLPIEAATAIASTSLPPIHSDPFDRLIIATALERNLTLLTPDQKIRQYPSLKTLW